MATGMATSTPAMRVRVLRLERSMATRWRSRMSWKSDWLAR